MNHSTKSTNRLALILAAVLLTTASILLANQSGHPTRTQQETSRYIAPTSTTSLPNGFVDDSLARGTSPLALLTASPTPTPSRIYRVVEVRAAQQVFGTHGRLGEHGEVMGYIRHPDGKTSAAIWRNGVVQAISTSNAQYSEANDINESGQIVGQASFELDIEGDTPLGPVREGRYDAYVLPDTPLPNPNLLVQNPENLVATVQFAEALANNNVGQVIGYSTTNEGGPFGYQAFLWDTTVSGNPFRILDPLPGDSESRANDINDNGIVVGVSGDDVGFSSSIETRAVVWKNGRAIDVGKLPGLNRCKATTINNSDYVVGVCDNVGEPQTVEGFLWHDDNSNGESDTGELRTLRPFFPDNPRNYDINDQGQLTDGKFIYNDDNSNGLPDAGETKDLNSLIIDTSYVITSTSEINNRGQILASGEKRDAQGLRLWSGRVLLDPLPEPVIFVPGIAGSVLVDDPSGRNEELWPALLANRRRLSLSPSDNPSEDIEATDAIRNAIPSPRLKPVYDPLFKYLTEVGKFAEYEVNGDPSKRTTSGCDLTQKKEDPNLNPNLFVFAYDWRKSNVENAAKLKDYVGCVRRFHPDTKINIIAHSMGGLLSRRYVLDNPNDHHITRLITIGTPWLGAPKLLRVLETGEFIELGPIYMWVPDVKYIAPSLIGAHELLPSRAYQDLGAPPIFVKSGWDYDETGERYDSYDYDRVLQFLDKKYCPEMPCPRMPGTVGPGTTGDQFHSYSTTSDKQDDWRSDTTGVNYFHFYGIQHLRNTIGQIVAKPTTNCRNLPSRVCYPGHGLEPVFTRGDGTVPELSASRKASLLDLNAPNAKVIRVTNKNDDLAEHVKMLLNPAVHSAILKLLRGGTVSSSISSAVLQGAAARRFANHAQADDSSSTLSYYVSIYGGSSVVVADTQGNSTAPIEGDLMGTVPDVTLFSMGTDAKMISLPVSTTEQYTITFNVNDEPLALRIVKGENNVRPTDVIHYQDIDLPAGVSAKLVVSPDGFANLRYDSNGDGTYGTSVSPTIVLSGSAALDITAPTMTFAESPQDPTIAQVTITAADSGTGVRDVNYSTDGSHFQAYTGPLSLGPIQTPFISAFATDSAGNRSPMVTYPLGSPPITIRGTVKNHAGNLLSGATITLGGTTSATAQTDTGGNYEFANIPAGGYYWLSASLSGFGFSSYDRVVSNPITDRTVDFVGEGECEVASATSQPTAQTVCEGSRASFSVTATGTNLSFQWRKNGVPLSNGDNVSGAHSATLTINSVGQSDADTYDVVIIASCAPSAASNEARLIVIPFTDRDGDGQGDCIDLDDDNDGQKDVDENTCGSDPLVASSRSPDLDVDNEPDCVDADDDNDGSIDSEDAFPLDATESVDTDHDGTGNNADNNDDNDCFLDADDAFPLDPTKFRSPYTFDSTAPHIVFSSDRDGNYEIYGMREDGTEIVRLTTNSAVDTEPVLSPDRTRIAFTSTRDGNYEIYWMDADGSRVTRLTTHAAVDRTPAWSPDGKRIVFTSAREGINRIYSVNVADCTGETCPTPDATRLNDQEGVKPVWSPNGCKIAFAGPGSSGKYLIFSMDQDGQNLRTLTSIIGQNYHNIHPSWSPNGSRIAFNRIFDNGMGVIYTMNPDGSGVRLLTLGYPVVGEPAWGMNGKILFSFPFSDPPRWRIYSVYSDGTGMRRLYTNETIVRWPHW